MRSTGNIVKSAIAAVTMLFAVMMSVNAQNRASVIGAISDSNGDPLPSATVQIKGTAQVPAPILTVDMKLKQKKVTSSFSLSWASFHRK